MSAAPPVPDPFLDAPLPDSRQMCHRQGKVFVHMREGDKEHIWAEWPDGTLECRHIESGAVHRKLPNGEFVEIVPEQLASEETQEYELQQTLQASSM